MSQILIIDDDVELCDLLTKYLSSEGFSVTCCHDGKNGIKTLLSNDFQAIVLDVMLPNMNGFEVLSESLENDRLALLMLCSSQPLQIQTIELLQKSLYSVLLIPIHLAWNLWLQGPPHWTPFEFQTTPFPHSPQGYLGFFGIFLMCYHSYLGLQCIYTLNLVDTSTRLDLDL